MWDAFMEITSCSGTDRCNIQSNRKVLNQQSFRTSTDMMSSLLGEIHPEKRGSPGKWPLSRKCNKWKTNEDKKRWLNSRINMHKYKVEVVTLSPMKTVSKRECYALCFIAKCACVLLSRNTEHFCTCWWGWCEIG
jgi:hypothetical protein